MYAIAVARDYSKKAEIMFKLLMLDLDGTIRQCKSNPNEFINSPEDQEIILVAEKAIKHYHEKEWKIVGISNQGGCSAINPETGRPYKVLEDAIAESHYTLKLFPQILCIYICPDFEGKHCWLIGRKHDEVPVHTTEWGREFVGTFRKPQPGMLNAAIKMSGFKEQKSKYWFIGDRPEDEEGAMRAGVNFMPAEIWLNRFRPGVHEMNISRKQVEFLEGIELKEDRQ